MDSIYLLNECAKNQEFDFTKLNYNLVSSC